MAQIKNDILRLRGNFEQRKNPGRPGYRNIKSGALIQNTHLRSLKSNLEQVKQYWENNSLFSTKLLISVYYKTIIAKSNRLQVILSNDSIVGAKFSKDNKHIITHYISTETLDKSIALLDNTIDIIDNNYNGRLSYAEIENINKNAVDFTRLSKSTFVSCLVDAFYVDKFDIELCTDDIDETSIVTLYKTDIKASEIIKRLGFLNTEYKFIDNTTVILNPKQFSLLRKKYPYIIAMKIPDLLDYTSDNTLTKVDIDEDPNFPPLDSPTDEPIIGVIDTQFDEKVYFRDWVEYHNELDNLEKTEQLTSEDYEHGTMVSSIIVDGPALNPRLEDHCGRFRVKHFGVARNSKMKASSLMEEIERIVVTNENIKVWNLSLGSNLEITNNFISPEAALLDKLQYDYDIVFIVAGTNDNRKEEDMVDYKKIGAPADSINSLVVNSVDFDNNPASYSRTGPVLSFFNKPDISYYGGVEGDEINVYGPNGKVKKKGTSFAAPWITRKMAYLIYKIGLSREVAKALIIDSAVGWSKQKNPSNLIGWGVVPIDIMDIIQSEKDEIRFVISGVSEQFDTYNYNIPVPVSKDTQPYIARATLCYFPKCSRNQGVDYTNTELDIHFGRIKDRKEIKSINNNIQCENQGFMIEEDARKLYRKWDNIKVIGEEYTKKVRARKVYGSGRWGISLKTKERLTGNSGKGLNLGVVITLKEINGVNRIDEFIRQCSLHGWIINRINVNTRLQIYAKAEEIIEFE